MNDAGEPADDHMHFHNIFVFVDSMDTGCNQHAENCAVNGADDRIAG